MTPPVSAAVRERDAKIADGNAEAMETEDRDEITPEMASVYDEVAPAYRRLAHLSRHAAKVQEASSYGYGMHGDHPGYVFVREEDFKRQRAALDTMLAEPSA